MSDQEKTGISPEEILDKVVEFLPEALDILGELAKHLPGPEAKAVATALTIIRILLEEGENAADAVRKVRAVYSKQAQELADTFTH